MTNYGNSNSPTQGQQPPQGQYGYVPELPGPEQQGQGSSRGVLIGIVAVVAVLAIAGAGVFAWLFFSGGDSAPEPDPTEQAVVEEEWQQDPKADEPAEEPEEEPAAEPESEPKEGPGDDAEGPERIEFTDDDPELEGDGPLIDRIEDLQVKYQEMRDDGSLWDLIEESPQNLGASIAFSYILTDARSALRFDSSAAGEEYYSKYAKLMETRFLNEEPLGVDLEITMSDGTVFTYDGDTGESQVE